MSSHAVNVSLDGSGQALLYPYYNVNDGNMTFVSVTNTTTDAKAIKVRFREGAGSEDVFDISVYLSPEDVWVAAIMRNGDSVNMSIPSDTSCTVPSKAAIEGTAFNPTRIPAEYTESVPNRLSEGHIEIIEMAVLPDEDVGVVDGVADTDDIRDAIFHNQAATPPTPTDCNIPISFSANQSWAILDDTTAGGNVAVTAGGITQHFAPPSGGLIGNAAIFNPNSGIYYPYNATALNQYSANPIWWPQNSLPFESITDVTAGGGAGAAAIAGNNDSNGNAHTNYFSADDNAPLSAGGNALNFDLPDLSTPSVAEVAASAATANQYTTQAASFNPTVKTDTFTAPVANTDIMDMKRNAVTASLMGNAITGEYLTTGTFGTDWIVTFPTRYLHVGEDITTTVPDEGFVAAPFTVEQTAATGQACHTVDFDYYNREETQNTVAVDVSVSPGVPTPGVSLCYEVNVLSMNDSSAAGTVSDVVGSITNKAVFDLGGSFADGWARLGFGAYTLAGDAVTFTGLPVVGFSAVNDVVSGTEKGGVFASRVTFDQTP
jgi:hypothetical protein